MDWILFFNSNFFVALITLAVGGSAIFLYIEQKIDHKVKAARLILQEIRYAEQQIRNSGRGIRAYPLSSKLLPTNSWNDNIHLFTTDLKETEIDMISQFYSNARFIDSLITERANQKINPSFVPSSIPAISGTGGTPTQQPAQQIMQQVVSPAEIITNQILTEVSSSIEFIYNTPIVEKLRKIAEKKWYQLF